MGAERDHEFPANTSADASGDAGNREQQERHQETHGQDGKDLRQETVERRLRQFDAALHADRKQQQDAEQFVDGRGYAQVRAGQAGEDSQREEPDYGVHA